MRKTLSKVVLAVLLAGLLTGGIAIASAATKVRTVTTPQGTTVDVISVKGTVTEVSAPATTTAGTGFMGMFRHQQAGYAKIKDSTDGTVYTLELGRRETANLTMKAGDTVTVEGTSETRNGVNELRVWTFTGADGKTVTLRGQGFGGRAGYTGEGPRLDRGFHGGRMGPGCDLDDPASSGT